jgi:hypothetical protein
MMYFIELIRYLPGRAEPEVLSRIKHADRDPEGARAKAKSIFLQTKVAVAERVRVLNSEGVEILNWGALGLRSQKRD